MRVVAAPQEFKGSLTARQAAAAIAAGVRRALPDAMIDSLPLADGGPGTLATLVAAAGGRTSFAIVEGPLGAPVLAPWGRIDDGRTAVIEMAEASGLLRVAESRRDPGRAGTYGTGELIRAALDAGVTRILIGVGGSATTDGGAGAAAALGARFLDDDGHPLEPGGAALARLARVDASALDDRLRGVEVIVLADVTNVLIGPEGASELYAPQKGADAAAVAALERALRNYADIVERDLGVSIRAIRGGGAAGGLAGGLVAFAGAEIRPGFAVVADVLRLRERVARADLVVTGEGRLDRQSAFGKAVAGVAALAAAAGVPCLAVAGEVAGAPDDRAAVRSIAGLVDCEAATPPDLALAEAFARAGDLVAAATERLLRRRFPAAGGG